MRFNRLNLAGAESRLFYELLRVPELCRKVFGRKFKILFFIENVSSMDKSALKEISSALGVKPYKLQCAEASQVSRPRFCWTNHHPPPKPAGLDRTPADARGRWAADEFRYPPYQYKSQYVIWTG